MSGLNDKISMVTGALGRQLRNFGVAGRLPDQTDPRTYEAINRKSLERLFEMPASIRSAPRTTMQDSEWLERKSMERIRSALYTDDCP